MDHLESNDPTGLESGAASWSPAGSLEWAVGLVFGIFFFFCVGARGVIRCAWPRWRPGGGGGQAGLGWAGVACRLTVWERPIRTSVEASTPWAAVTVNLLYVRREVALRPEIHERTSHVPVWVGPTKTSIPGRVKSAKCQAPRHAMRVSVCVVWVGQLAGTTQGTRWGPRRQWRRMSTSTALAHASALVAGGCGCGCGWCSTY